HVFHTRQVSQLKQNQVEFESTKHETLRLRGDLEDLNMQLDELGGLKSIVEAKLGEALQALVQEREQKHSLKKELDQRISQESMFNLSNLAHLGGLSEGLTFNNHSEPEEDMEGSAHPALKRIEADFNFSGGKQSEDGNPTPRPGTVGDILSEIQVTEVGKLESLLQQSEDEKMELQKALDDAKKLIEDTQKDLIEQKERADHLKTTISNVAALQEGAKLPNDLQVGLVRDCTAPRTINTYKIFVLVNVQTVKAYIVEQGGSVVSASDLLSGGHGFDSQPRRML
ncbi:bicaudal D-like protein 2, partial [Elysia marginata]